jgi:ribosomal protein S18 acetylase RimI-like enzyme
VEVVTQGRNVRAIRFYQRAGFTVSDVGLWYHWWIAAMRPVQ